MLLAELFILNYTCATQIYTLSLHDALPICFLLQEAAFAVLRADVRDRARPAHHLAAQRDVALGDALGRRQDRKSTRLNSSHSQISYAVFCLKKKRRQIISA